MNIYIYIHTHTHTYIYIYIHTHTHTQNIWHVAKTELKGTFTAVDAYIYYHPNGSILPVPGRIYIFQSS